DNQSLIRRIDATTGIIQWLPTPIGVFVTPEGFRPQSPRQMALDAQNRLYFTDDYHDLVFRVSGLTAPPVDTTPPVVPSNVSGTAGNNGWYRSNGQVTWTVSDAESSISSSTGCSASSVTTDTAGVTFTCTASSAGGTTTRSVTIRRDTIAPLLSFTVSPA